MGAPLVAALVAFGPISGRPLFLNDVGLLYLALLAWKLYPLLKAAFLSAAPVRRRDVWIAVLAISLGFFLLDHPRPLDGDEPHYLVYADSLMRDRDADLRNNYDPRITGRFANGLTCAMARPSSSRIRRRGKVFCARITIPACRLPCWATPQPAPVAQNWPCCS